MQNGNNSNPVSEQQPTSFAGSKTGAQNQNINTDLSNPKHVNGSGTTVVNNQLQTNEPADPRFRNAVVDSQQQTTVSQSGQTKPPRKKISKMVLFVVVFILLLSGLVFIFLKFRGNGIQTHLGNKGEIIWWGIQHDLSIYKPLIDEFEKENPNIKIVYERQSSQDYLARLVSVLSSGKGPDIFEIHNTWPVMLKNELSTLPSSVMTEEEFKKSFYPIIISNLTLDKGIVGMPLEYDALTLYINEDVFTSALKSPPETWSDLLSLAPKLTQTGAKGVIIQGGIALGITKNVDHWPEVISLMLIQNGVNPGKPTGQLSADVFSFYKSFEKAKVWSDKLPASTLAFSRGELAMYFGPGSRAGEIVKNNPDLKFRTVKLPQLPKNKPEDPDYSYATYWLHAVSEKSKIKEGAWTFLKYLAREDSLKKINEKIEEMESFKRVYPRPEMNVEIAQDPILGSVVAFSYNARSFYLADNTNDGQNGINTLIKNLYKDVVDKGGGLKNLDKLSQDLSQTLGKFGIRIR